MHEYRYRVEAERNTLHTIRRRAKWIGHILRKNCLLKHVAEGMIEGTRTRGIRCKQLLDDLKQTIRYAKLKEKAPDRTLGRTRFRRAYWTCRKTRLFDDDTVMPDTPSVCSHHSLVILPLDVLYSTTLTASLNKL
jgi:hypothetical protein